MPYINHSSHNMKPSSSSSSSSPACIISNWFSKLKLHKAAKPSPKTKQKDQHGRFYTMDEDDAYWRLSFGADESRRSSGGINPLWYDYSDEFHAPPVCSGNENYQNFNEMVSHVKKIREYRGKQNVDYQQSSRKSIIREEQQHHGQERDVFSLRPLQMKRDPCNTRKQPKIQNFSLRSVKQDYAFEAVKGDGGIPIPEDTKLKKIKVKTERYGNIISRESQVRSRVRAYSPRTECKIRALEDMKKARMKSKKMMKEGKEQSCRMLDSFAVVKNSFNPEKDFRDSMVEMVREKGIARPQQLEQLLACYLTLNSDEYHDLIIKVFRQLWSDLNSQIQ